MTLTPQEKQVIERLDEEFKDLHNDYWRKKIKTFLIQAIRDTEKQVMEKYNMANRVAGKSTEIQLDKWEEAIRTDEREKRDREIEEKFINKCPYEDVQGAWDRFTANGLEDEDGMS